jgi:carbon storage regulator
MLVLSRKVADQIVIAGRIRITVARLAGNRVSLAIEAPDDVSILRGELASRERAPERLPSVTELQTA